MLCKCCANLGIKKVKVLKISTLTLAFVGITGLEISTLTLAFVGITGLEPATSRPPDVCATNCAKSRSVFCLASDLMSDLRVQNYELSVTFANFMGTFFVFTCF